MGLYELMEKFRHSREMQIKALFAEFFIIQNKLQTLFDKTDAEITSKQFLLLILIKESESERTLSKLGRLLGCSRQNIKKLAVSLEKKGFVTIVKNKHNARGLAIVPLPKLYAYFERVEEKHKIALEALFSSFTDEEVEAFFALMEKMASGLEEGAASALLPEKVSQ